MELRGDLALAPPSSPAHPQSLPPSEVLATSWRVSSRTESALSRTGTKSLADLAGAIPGLHVCGPNLSSILCATVFLIPTRSQSGVKPEPSTWLSLSAPNDSPRFFSKWWNGVVGLKRGFRTFIPEGEIVV